MRGKKKNEGFKATEVGDGDMLTVEMKRLINNKQKDKVKER